MRGSVPCLLLILCTAAVASGCGSSSTSTTRTQVSRTPTTAAPTTAAAIAGHELTRLNAALPIDAVRLPPPSPKPVVESRYLTALFDDAQTMWRRNFAAAGLSYKPAHLVVYWSKIESVCGRTDDSGPFFCSGDRTVYLDLRFFTLLEHRYGVQEVAQAYIVGHEVGHNVQNLLGVAHRVDIANQADPKHRNARSVLVELQADCLAGVWGRTADARSVTTEDDLQEAVKTADVIGDDYEARAVGEVADESLWTHGSSQQRQYWLRTGFRSGKPAACDTFAHR
jgi:predicted metalloprotease